MLIDPQNRATPFLRALDAAAEHFFEGVVSISGGACLNMTAVTLELARRFKVKAAPLSVSFEARNAAYEDFVARFGRAPTTTDNVEGAWAVIGGCAKPKVENGAWQGHLVAILDGRWIVDLSIGQAYRPERGIHMPSVLVGPVSNKFLRGEERASTSNDVGATLHYAAVLGDRSYLNLPGFQLHDRNRATADTIEGMMRRLLEHGSGESSVCFRSA